MPAPKIQRRARRHGQRGVMLLEALIAILIFSVGILGVVGLQATAVQQTTAARYRAEAALLAEQLIGTMWVDTRTATALKNKYESCGGASCTGYNEWLAAVEAKLPGVKDNDDNAPQVNVSDKGVVTITLFWQAPGEESENAHRYDVETQIGQ